jgi:hypothetical protein
MNTPLNTEPDPHIDLLEETARWRARNVKYWSGKWKELGKLVPQFRLSDFVAKDSGPANPYLKAVVREPLGVTEQAIPVGVVSTSYPLVQHTSVVEKCLEGLSQVDIEPKDLKCDLGLTELGEWMNFRIYFGERYGFKPADGHQLGLRLECFNSVDGSSRLVVTVGWLRFVCKNGVIIWEAQQELKDIHNPFLDLDRVSKMVSDSLGKVGADQRRLKAWEAHGITLDQVQCWSDNGVTEAWGKKAACRVFHICRSGCDVEITDPFVGGPATQWPVKEIRAVPGAANPARNLFDASQALSWVATNRNNAEERLEWQAGIPKLISKLRAHRN